MFLKIDIIFQIDDVTHLVRPTSGDLAVDDDQALPDPEEDAHICPTGPGVGGAAPALVTGDDGLAAVAVGADHGPTHQAQGRGLGLPRQAVGATEVPGHVHQVRVVPG